MSRHSLIGLFSVSLALIVQLTEPVLGSDRCPEHGSTDKPTINTYADDVFCNVFHQCNCTQASCELVQSNLCPIAQVYSKTKGSCLDIEEEGCDSTYVQWIQTHSTDSEQNQSDVHVILADSLLQKSVVHPPFRCERGQPGKFPDPNICNMFHVCIERNGNLIDQPYLCPYPTVFKIAKSGKMSCSRPNINDCKKQSFYHSTEPTEQTGSVSNDEVNYLLPERILSTQKCDQPGLYADELYCNAYHKCTSQGVDEHYLCENQLLFNPESGICDYPINVGCGGKSLYRRPATFLNGTYLNSSTVMIFGQELRPKCSSSNKTEYYVADEQYCNVFFRCQRDRTSIYVCRENEAFDISNAAKDMGICRPKEQVNCGKRLLLTERSREENPTTTQSSTQRTTPPTTFTTSIGSKIIGGKASQSMHSNLILLPTLPPQNQKVITNVPFDCKGRIDGHWRDARYCDIFHACLAGEQKRSYGCNQVGERFYFDDASQKCEFVSQSPNGCPSNQYYTPIEPVPVVPGSQLVTEPPSEPWKIFIQSREQFTCNGKQDGFYASRWCNVFYRCHTGISTAFLCPKMPNGDRLWWVQHGSPQGVAQETAACTWPCETSRRCASSGGIIVDTGSIITESQTEAENVFSQSSCVATGNTGGSGSSVGGGVATVNDDAFRVDSEVTCVGQADGIFLSSRYCNVFHRCVSGTRRDFRCPRATNTPYDLWWNQQTQQCDWPCRIQCSGSVFGTSTSSQQVRTENALLFSNECAGYQVQPQNTEVQGTLAKLEPVAYSSNGHDIDPVHPSSVKLIENPDPNYICTQIGKVPSRRYCNVYYECTQMGYPPTQTMECIDSFFDRSQGTCMSKDQVPCLGGIYPFDSVPIDRNPDSLQCSTTAGFQLHTSRQFCNIYYLCDGTQTTPTTFRCFDRETDQEAIFDPFAERCDSRKNTNCQNAILSLNQIQYRSMPVDHTRFPELAVLPCKYDQSYVLEHEQYCNLYHVCKQGSYQLYTCISNNEGTQPSSYFYQPIGYCAAPLPTLCPKSKTVFSYARMLGTGNEMHQAFVLPEKHQVQGNYGSIPIQERVEPIPICREDDNYITPHERYCNLFYGCKDGELILYACVDRSTNTYGGVFQGSTGNCIASNECPTNEYYRPSVSSTARPTSNAIFGSYTMAEASNRTRTAIESVEINSPFSCGHRADGYYESEWCNVFYRCISGKRIDERCPIAGTQALANYDLWWRHQNVNYNITHPHYYGGLDYMVRCDWPCKVQCKKPIWISKDHPYGNAEYVRKQDEELRPGCQSIVNRKIENSMQIPSQMIMYSDIPNPSNYSCPSSVHGVRVRMPDPKYCNIFHECTHTNLMGSYLCIESQYSAKDSDCVPLSTKSECPIEQRYSYQRSRLAAQASAATYYEAIEVRSANPSGYECITDGIHTDPMFCNLFHACSGRTRRTFQCRQTGTDGINEGVSTFDLNTKSCTRFSTYSCSSLLYNQDFAVLPVMFKPPTVSPCGKQGFFPVSDITAQYCNMFAWCPKGHGEPKVFECVPSSIGAPVGAFDISRRSCTAKTSCPRARHGSSFNTSILALTLKPKIVSIGNRKQFSLTSTMLENGYIALGPDFQTSFNCPSGSTGFYSNPEYCDVFHYCYETGEVSSFVCASMPNRYQLWWSHHNEQGRADNVFCDWPCNLQGVYMCPSHKSILMRDRQPVGSIAQTEVFEATCSSAQVPSTDPPINFFTPEPVPIVTPGFIPPEPSPESNFMPLPPSPGSNFIHPQPPSGNPGSSTSALSYRPCVPSSEWYVSPSTIRCSGSFAAMGFAPDPKDCSKYYICDSLIGLDGMSNGNLMQCLAGLWWDQQRRTCVLPSEVACNPFNIINSHGQGSVAGLNPDMNFPSIPPSIPPPIQTIPPIITPFTQPPQPVGTPSHVSPGSGPCRGAPSCVEVGLNILQQMKAIPGRPGWFYKCDSQCAMEMRCPPALVFDDHYQRCEWPGANSVPSRHYRLSSLRESISSNKSDNKPMRSMRLMTTKNHKNSTVSSPTMSKQHH